MSLVEVSETGPAPSGAGHFFSRAAAFLAAFAVAALVALPLFGVKGATITPALSFAKGGSGSKNQTAARVRINYSV